MNVLLVCHAGAGVGLGHLTRSIVAARALTQEIDANVSLLIQGDPVQRTDLGLFSHRFIERTDSLLAAIGDQVRRLLDPDEVGVDDQVVVRRELVLDPVEAA